MAQLIKQIHHVTATVDHAQVDLDFYVGLLGLRLVKKTVNFDNNGVYHFYYGNANGMPGSIMTTFPYEGQGIRQGKIGYGQVGITSFAVPSAALPFWADRLRSHGIEYLHFMSYFGDEGLVFKDPVGLNLTLVGLDDDPRVPWTTDEVEAKSGIRGFHSVTLSVAEARPTIEFFKAVYEIEPHEVAGKMTRFLLNDGGFGVILDLEENPKLERGQNGIGTVHHLALAVENDEVLLEMRERLIAYGLKPTELKDRKYFHSVYCREPGGVLIELATLKPGFAVDEPPDSLGTELMLPEWEETNRKEIEGKLPVLEY